MTVTVASFRTAFTAFSDATVYPDATIQLWIDQWPILYNALAFAATADTATMLWVAHVMAMTARDVQAAQNGGVPGQASGPLQTKQVGNVSAGYDTVAGSIKDAGWYNNTSYGVAYYQLLMIAGMGGIQAIGCIAGLPTTGVWDNGNAIPGLQGL